MKRPEPAHGARPDPARGARARALLAPSQPASTPALSDREFELFRAWVQGVAGIQLAPVKKPLLVARIGRRLRALRLDSFEGYFRRLTSPDGGDERDAFLDCITTHETHFFREPRQLEYLTQRIFPAWSADAGARARSRHIRAWSAGCSTGEEPYSVAMLLLDHFPAATGFTLEVLATDLSLRVLEQARQAVYPLRQVGEIPPRYREAYMLRGKGSQQGRMRAGPALRERVRFQPQNLHEESYAVEGLFDLILCRNVLIYFDPDARAAVIDRLLSRLAPGGYLLLGHAESLRSVTARVRLVAPTIYTHASEPERRQASEPEPRT